MSQAAIVISLLVLLTAGLGSYFSTGGMEWYQTLTLPGWIPPGYLFSLVWTIIFVLTGLAAYYLWTKYLPRDIRFWFVVTLLLANAVLNVLWSFLFFTEHMLGAATIDAGALLFITGFIIFLAWPNARRSALLLLPYGLWLIFATYLSYTVWTLN